MIHLNQTVVVEGKYDKIKLQSILDANILETGGFRLFQDREKADLLRRLARRDGIIVLTDSDVAGFRIRNYIRNLVGNEGKVIHVYIPDIFGKERRKEKPSKEGKLGVEGISPQILLQAFEKAGVFSQNVQMGKRITKADFYQDGLSGRADSVHKRKQLIKSLDLPEHLSANALIAVLNSLMSYEEYRDFVIQLDRYPDENSKT